MFPEIRSAFKRLLERNSAEPISIAKEMRSMESKGALGMDPNDPSSYARAGFYGIASGLQTWMPAWSGESVTIQTALNHSVVYACNKLISESLGMLPLSMKKTAGAGTIEATTHPVYGCLKNAPSDEMTAKSFKETLTSHRLLAGMGYAHIIRRSGTGVAVEMHPLIPSQVTPDREHDGAKRLVYIVKERGVADKTYTLTPGKPQDLLVMKGLGWDGLRGYSVIAMGRQSIGTAISAERNVARFYARGGRVPYVIEMKSKFKTDQDFQKWRAEWEATTADPNRAPILENDMTYKQTGLNLVDSQMLETRLFDIHEICRWFLVSPHLVGDLSRATFSNIEQLALEFVKMTLHTHIISWEQELWRCVLTPEEKHQGYFFKYNVNALLRGDFASRMAGYSTLLQNGIASCNEVRDLEDWNPFKGGDAYHIQLNQSTLPGTGAPLTPQAAQLVSLGAD